MPFCWRFKKTIGSDEVNQNQGSPVTSSHVATSGITSATTGGSTDTSSASRSSPYVQDQAEKRPDSVPNKQFGEPSGWPGQTSPNPQRKPRRHPSGIPRSPSKTAPSTPSPGNATASSWPPSSAPASSRSRGKSTASEESPENASAGKCTTGSASTNKSSPGKSLAREPPAGQSSARTHSPIRASASTKPPESSKDSKPSQSGTDSKTTETSTPPNKSSANGPSLPRGNVFPSGKIPPIKIPPSTAILNPDRRIDYGYGNIMWKRKDTGGVDYNSESEQVQKELQLKHPEDIKKAGNEHYKNGRFREAVLLYDRAIELLPHKAAYWSNRAAALTGLGRLAEAVRDCEVALKLDISFARAHQRLGMLFLRFGLIENARRQLSFPNLPLVQSDVLQLISVEKHMSICSILRQRGDWVSLLSEVEATIAAGVDSSPQLFLCKAEALLKLNRINEVESFLKNLPKIDEPRSTLCHPEKFCGIHSNAYLSLVTTKIEMALGRFENAVTAAEKAAKIEPENPEVVALLNNVKLVARARTRGNDLFKSDRFTEATVAYGYGIKIEPTNSVLYSNRAACWFKIGQWERAIDDCSQALHFRPKYRAALLRRAASCGKLERWAEAIKDYEALRTELPDDKDVAEQLSEAQIALKQSLREELPCMKFDGEVELITDSVQYQAAKSLPDVSVIYFEAPANPLCKDMSPFVDTLCSLYPSISFYKMDVKTYPNVARDIRVVPAFKIFKDGIRLDEMICLSRDKLRATIKDVAEQQLFQGQVTIKQSLMEEVSNMKFGGEVEVISDAEQFQAAKSLPDVSVIYFEIPYNFLCKEMSPFVDALCSRYPSINFYKVDIKACAKVANDIRVVPAFRIYKDGIRLEEIICPSRRVLEKSMKHYGSMN